MPSHLPADEHGEPWAHGSRLGRTHRSLRQHLVEDHGFHDQDLKKMSDGALHGTHDRLHDRTWAYAFDLPHG